MSNTPLISLVVQEQAVDELELLRALLSPDLTGDRWHLDYGITAARRAALARGATDSNSLLHPAAETALTLHILGMIDGWSQIDALATTPRNHQDAWNSTFFANLRDGVVPNYRSGRAESKTGRSSWASLFPGWLGRDSLDLKEAVLLFEFDLSATDFHPVGRRLVNPSFLALQNESGWSTFDAVLIVPQMKLFLLFEAKLNSDIGIGTTHFPFVNQIVRNLEAAYFLTHDPASAYAGWDYRYIFLGPRRAFDWRLTQYSWVVADIGEQADAHRRVLEELRGDPHHQVIEERFALFSDFRAKSVERSRRCTWDDLVAALGPAVFSAPAYLNSLQSAGVPAEVVEAVQTRLTSAGLRR